MGKAGRRPLTKPGDGADREPPYYPALHESNPSIRRRARPRSRQLILFSLGRNTHTHMPHSKVRFAGFELYFDDLERARCFYTMKLGLRTIEHDPTHHVKLASGDASLCLEREDVA